MKQFREATINDIDGIANVKIKKGKPARKDVIKKKIENNNSTKTIVFDDNGVIKAVGYPIIQGGILNCSRLLVKDEGNYEELFKEWVRWNAQVFIDGDFDVQLVSVICNKGFVDGIETDVMFNIIDKTVKDHIKDLPNKDDINITMTETDRRIVWIMDWKNL